MRIGINTYFLRHPNTGSGQYCARLIEALGEIDRENVYHFIAPEVESLPGLNQNGSNARELSRTVQTPPKLVGRQMGKVWFEQITVPRVCAREAIDLIHYPYFAAPLFGSSKVVLTLHDLIPMLLDQYKGSPLVRAYSHLAAAGAKRAAGIVVDSEHTKRDIMRMLRIPEWRIRVVHLAASEKYAPVIDPAASQLVRSKYGLSSNFVLYLGGLDVRKNVVRLIRAFARLVRETTDEVQLAIAGKAMSEGKLFPRLEGILREEQIADKVLFLGQVPEEDCPLLHNAARLFIYPSLYEGFGLPPLEAMACGTPVICSNTSSLPEVVGDAAITVDPTDVDALAQAMKRVLASVDLQDELRRRGLERARRFSWRKTAQETLAAFVEFAGETWRKPRSG